MTKTAVLDHGFVELLDSMGTDLSIVQAAQASFDRASEVFGDRERGILRALMRDEHGVPFEHVLLKFRVKMPIFVARQLVKHRISSWSEHSARYATMDVEYFLPELGEVRTQVGKPMQYRFQTTDLEVATQFLSRLENWCSVGLAQYQWALDHGVAKEQARLFIPIGAYTTVTWTMNVRSLLNLLHLRNDDHAQGETREFARAIEELAAAVIPETLAAFRELGRVAP